MKKKVAIFANGWNAENLYRFVDGLSVTSKPEYVDYCVFMCNSTYTFSEVQNKCASTIFDLPDLSKFDAIIIFIPGMNFQELIDYICDVARKSGKPTITIGNKYDDFYFAGIDNFKSMLELCQHVIDVHGAKKIKYIAGSAENEDSNERLRAVKSIMKQRGYKFDDEDVFYSDWESLPVHKYIYDILVNKKEVPDAVLCANDTLAEAASYAVEEAGFSVNNDIIITGFDHIDEGQIFYPSLTTVDQCFDKLGQKVAEMIFDILEGNGCEQQNYVDSRLCIGESCGCNCLEYFKTKRIKYVRQLPVKNVEIYKYNGMFEAFESTIISSDDYFQLKSRLNNFYSHRNGNEGDTFYCIFDPELQHLGEKNSCDFPQYTFAEKMDTAISKMDGVHPDGLERYSFDTKDLIPDYNWTGKNRVFVFVPIHYETYVCGYLVFGDHINWINEKTYYLFEKCFNQSLFLYRKNAQLNCLNAKMSELMKIDPLTSVKNRVAYENYVSVSKHSFDNGDLQTFAVVNFDINNLKIINDNLGHQSGDSYIKNCCRLMCRNFKFSPIFRIGGDEFIVILIGSDYDRREECLENFRKEMVQTQNNKNILERLSIASGMAVYDKNIDIDFESVFQRADDMMYKNKTIMKKNK